MEEKIVISKDKTYLNINNICLREKNGVYYLGRIHGGRKIPYVLYLSDNKDYFSSHEILILKRRDIAPTFLKKAPQQWSWHGPGTLVLLTDTYVINMMFLGGPNLIDIVTITPEIVGHIFYKTDISLGYKPGHLINLYHHRLNYYIGYDYENVDHVIPIQVKVDMPDDFPIDDESVNILEEKIRKKMKNDRKTNISRTHPI